MIQDLEFDLDFKHEKIQKKRCKQSDTINFIFNIFDDGIAIDITGYTVILNCNINNSNLVIKNDDISISNNIIKIFDKDKKITTLGKDATLELVLSKDGIQKTSFNIKLEVQKSVLNTSEHLEEVVITALANLQEDLNKASATVQKLEEENTKANNNTNSLSTENAKAETNYNNLKNINNNLSDLLEANSTAETNINNLISENSKATANIEAIKNFGDVTNLAQQVETNKQNIAENTTQLNDIANIKLVKDIPSTDYVQGQLIGGDFIRTRQIINYADFFRKLRKKESVQICCMGDSLTNGQDTVSADVRPVASDPTRVSGEATSSQTIASVTYPEALRNRLRTVYGEQVNVINRGYSGDWVKAGYTRYNTKHDSDLTIIMYGTNDSRASWVPEDIRGNLEEYIYWYEQLIVREILWGKAVIIMKPPKLLSASDLDVDIFRNALDALGEKYCIPVIDTEEFTANYSNSIYCDTTHFNGMGYSIFASRVAALLIGEGAFNPKKIMDGSKLLTRPTIDNIVYMGGAYFDTDTGVDTPNENNSAKGIVARIPAGGSIIYSFYVEEDDLVALPYAYLVSGGTFKLELDFGVTQAQNSLDGALYLDRTTPDSTVQYTSYSNAGLYNKSKILDDNLSILRIVGKGWHTLRISSVDNTTVFSGLEFIAYEDVKQYKDINKLNTKQGFYYGLTHSSYSATPEVVTETRIKVSTLLEHLGRTDILTTNEYWKHPPFKITVFNYGQSIIEYMFCCGSLGDGANSFFCGEISRKNIATTPTERTISNIIFDSITQEIVITWDGANRVANFVIGLAF